MVELVEGDIDRRWYNEADAVQTVAIDIETSGLNKRTDRIATIQMHVPHFGTIMVRNFSNPLYLMGIIESPHIKKIFHYASFDLAFIVRDFGIWPENIADTKIAAKLLDPKRKRFIHPETGKGSHSLISLVNAYFDQRLDKSIAVSDWFAKELSQEQLDYAENDVLFLPQLLANLESDIQREHGYSTLKLAREAYKHIPTHVILEVKNYEDVYGY